MIIQNRPSRLLFRRLLRAFSMVAMVVAAGHGCSSGSGSEAKNEPDAGSRDGSTDAPLVPPVDANDEEEGRGGEKVPAELVPLDLYVMFDASASMDYQVGSTALTKWKAVTQALLDFVKTSDMERLNVGLQLFPLMRPEVPVTCTNDDSCNGFGPCKAPKLCEYLYQQGIVRSCNTYDDCVIGGVGHGQCFPQGYCTGNPNRACLPEYEALTGCAGGAGACVKVPASCVGRQSCDMEDYAKPAVPLGPCAEVHEAMKNVFSAKKPEGATPTGPALAGAIAYLQARLEEFPNNKAAVVFVTDGLPTDCTPVDVPAIAAIAAAAVPAVSTFVIGVFDDETAANAKKNLDTIAKAGQTNAAFIVTATGDAVGQFKTSLASIRSHYIACEYAIPESTTGEFEHDLVNVDVIRGDGPPETLDYVGNEGLCGKGWYYDVEPSNTETPSMIRLCPETCAAIQGDAQTRVNIRLGCPTQVVK